LSSSNPLKERRPWVLAFFAQLPACLVGMEACGSAHHWAVKPYVRRQKNDAADAAGICEAVTRPSMRFAGVRTLENQAALMHHKAREMLVAQRTKLTNALRGHLAEMGVITAKGRKNARELTRVILAEGEAGMTKSFRATLPAPTLSGIENASQ
jgi:transposase